MSDTRARTRARSSSPFATHPTRSEPASLRAHPRAHTRAQRSRRDNPPTSGAGARTRTRARSGPVWIPIGTPIALATRAVYARTAETLSRT